MKLGTCIVALSAVAIAMAGLSCAGKKDKSVRIAVIPKGTSHVFWKSVHAGANRAARELGIEDPIWQGPATEKETSRQIDIVQDMMSKNVSAIVLAPLDQKSLTPTVDAAAKKVPVVIFDSGISGTDAFTAFVATDNEKGGRIAGEHMLKVLGEQGGKILMVRVAAESASTLAREKGFRDTVKGKANIELVESPYTDSDRENARKASADLLDKHKDIKAVFGPNESSAVGALMAVKERQKEGQLTFVGFDSSDELADALDKGRIQGLVLQDPVMMGYLSVKAAYESLQGKEVEKNQPIEPTLITKENKDQPRMKELLRPNLEKDLGPRK